MRRLLFGGAAGAAVSTPPASSSSNRTRPLAFDAARQGRRLAAIPATTRSPNLLVRQFGRTALARSRYLCANDPQMASAKRVWALSLVGDGITPAPRLDPDLKKAFQDAFFDWSDESDADGLLDFYGQQWLAAMELFEAGELFIRRRPRRPEDGLSVPLQLQMLSAEMCPIGESRQLGNGNEIQSGIEFDRLGRRVAFHFLRQHPGDLGTGAFGTTRVPAEDVIHIFRPQWIGQIRGVPQTLPSIVSTAMRSLYFDNELERKRVAALYAMIITRPPPEEGQPNLLDRGTATSVTDDDGRAHGLDEDEVGLSPGVTLELDEGQTAQFSEPADVGPNFEAFLYRDLLAEAAGVGVTYAGMTGDWSKANFGSQRAGEIQFRRGVSAEQHHVLIYQACRRVWQWWVPAAVLAGAVPVSARAFERDRRAFLRVDWKPPGWTWLDPLKDMQAEQIAVAQGFKARDDVIEETGYDADEIDRRRQASKERAERLGVPVAGNDGASSFAEPPDADEDVDDDVGEEDLPAAAEDAA